MNQKENNFSSIPEISQQLEAQASDQESFGGGTAYIFTKRVAAGPTSRRSSATAITAGQ